MKPNIEYLRQKTDLNGKYVDFNTIRGCLTVLTVAEDIGTDLNEPNDEGECRGDCPKCEKPRSFSLNINSNRFNCFSAECDLKGAGVITFASIFFDTEDAKEACHLLACAYGIQPYNAEFSGASLSKLKEVENGETEETNNHFVLRSDYDDLETKHNDLRKEFNRLRNIVYCFMLEQEQGNAENYENGETNQLVI